VPHAGFPLIFASPNPFDPIPQSPQLACCPRPARTSPLFLDVFWYVDRDVSGSTHSILYVFVLHFACEVPFIKFVEVGAAKQVLALLFACEPFFWHPVQWIL
jgi:hypothetical protein